ncbi:MAG: CapA family protein, partial [Alphaproteobacteria bacterium]|nr:CapA family protein [Alphaproteobacteria bacterium]
MTEKNVKLEAGNLLTLFLCGDVMTGRGIDQVLPHPNPPHLMEPFMTSALQYVDIAERANGPIAKPVAFPYIWGEALAELDRVRPDLRIVNLETAVTTSEDCQPKGINYRMHPKNISCLNAAGIDCCLLGNNHVLDWGRAGLLETLASLEAAGIKTAGAGRDLKQAEEPAILEVPGKGRVIVYSFGDVSSGVPRSWAASADRPGVNLLSDLSERTAVRIAGQVKRVKRSGDVAVASIHWGGNWGYEIPPR